MLHRKTEYLFVLNDIVPAVFLGEKALLLGLFNAFAVTEMVCAEGDKAVGRQKGHEIIISVDVLGNAVHYLNDASDISVWNAAADMDAVLAGA